MPVKVEAGPDRVAAGRWTTGPAGHSEEPVRGPEEPVRPEEPVPILPVVDGWCLQHPKAD